VACVFQASGACNPKKDEKKDEKLSKLEEAIRKAKEAKGENATDASNKTTKESEEKNYTTVLKNVTREKTVEVVEDKLEKKLHTVALNVTRKHEGVALLDDVAFKAAKARNEKFIEEEKERKKNELADHADDSFKDFMKQEDGEDQQGDTDYEDSANALAGAIGWNRQDIESNANKAVKSLTEAIGGKKVIQSLQGMMAGVSR